MPPKYRADLPTPNSNGFGASLRETVMTYLGKLGDPLDRGITVRDLVESKIIQVDRRAWNGGVEPVPMTPGPSVEKKYEIDLTPPPTPEGFAVTPAISHVLITHSAPTYRQGHGHLRTRVYGVTITGPTPPTFSNAVELGQFSGTTWAMPSNPATTWRLWIKWETADGVLSTAPAGGTNGLLATTGQDVGKLLEALTGEITESQLYNALGERIDLIDRGPNALVPKVAAVAGSYTVKVDVNGYVSGFGLASTANNAAPTSDFAVRADRFYIANPSGPGIAPAMPFIVQTTPTTINGVNVPVGVYINDAFIQNGTITNAKIADAAIDNAKIANLSADKITAGSLAVGQHIQSSNYVPGVSGWRVNADGTAELNNVSVRGTVNAQSGQFSGAIVGASINGSVITGGTFQTAASGQRIVMDDKGILFLTGNSPGKYGTFKYGQRKYGAGVLVYFNSVDKKVPFYVAAEQNVADIHLYNRGANPTGGTYEAGDMICVNGRLRIFVPALGGWKTVALEP